MHAFPLKKTMHINLTFDCFIVVLNYICDNSSKITGYGVIYSYFNALSPKCSGDHPLFNFDVFIQ